MAIGSARRSKRREDEMGTLTGGHCDFRTSVVPFQPDGFVDADTGSGGESERVGEHDPDRRYLKY
jgi:hypothetical protein